MEEPSVKAFKYGNYHISKVINQSNTAKVFGIARSIGPSDGYVVDDPSVIKCRDYYVSQVINQRKFAKVRGVARSIGPCEWYTVDEPRNTRARRLKPSANRICHLAES